MFNIKHTKARLSLASNLHTNTSCTKLDFGIVSSIIALLVNNYITRRIEIRQNIKQKFMKIFQKSYL